MSMTTSLHFHDGEPSPSVAVYPTPSGQCVEFGDFPAAASVYVSTPTHARDLAAGLVAAARQLDAWADKVDPDPITAAAERLIRTHEDVAS